jgi:hypothetical protein
MSIANPLWGAPEIHGKLLKPGIEIGQTSVAKHMARRRAPPSQDWERFLRNHADGIAAMDAVPTIAFRPPYGLLICRREPNAHFKRDRRMSKRGKLTEHGIVRPTTG